MGRSIGVNEVRGVLMLALLTGCTQREPTRAESTEPTRPY